MKVGKRFDPDTHYAIQELNPTADTSHVKRKFIDIPYADLSPMQKLDIYLPEEDRESYPVILSIHGGAFMTWDKSDTQVLPMLAGLDRGYAVVGINYRLSWEVIFPAQIHDIKAALRWVRVNASEYGFDPDHIAAWGGSAGGYLSSLLGVSAGVRELEDLSLGNSDQPSHIQAVVDWYGPTDFIKMDAQLIENGLTTIPGTEHSASNSPESLLLGATVADSPELVKLANPETYINDQAPPFLIQHGLSDPVVPVQQSIEFADKLKKIVGDKMVALELFEEAEHCDERFETPDNVSRVLDFLDEKLTFS